MKLTLALLVCVSPALLSAADAQVDYDEGFVLRSGERSFKLGGYLQTWHQSLVEDGQLTTNEFRIVRARFGAKAVVTRWLSFRVVTDLTKSNVLLDCYFDAKLAPWATLRVGQMKVPFVRQAYLSDSAQEFVGVSMATGDYKLPRDLGAMFRGSFADGVLELQLAALNGAGTNARQDNADLLWVGRLVLHPLGPTPLIEAELSGHGPARLALGVSGTFNHVSERRPSDEEGAEDLAVETDRAMAAGELTFLWRGLHLGLEGMLRHDEVEGGGGRDGFGGYAQTSYMLLPPYLQLGARASMLRPDTDTSEADRFEAAGVLSGYVDGHRLKLQLEVAALAEERAGQADVLQQRILLQVQAKF